MSFTFPEFAEPIPIDAQRSWTATHESYDQRNDDVFYIVTLHVAGGPLVRLMAKVNLYWAGDDWRFPEFVPQLRKRLHDIAASGQTNTNYEGPLRNPKSSS